MVIASMSSRIEAFAQLLTLLIIFIFVLAVTYYVTRFVGNYQKAVSYTHLTLPTILLV